MNENISKQEYSATAFVSSSLNKEDRPFFDCICRELNANNIKTTGTVGLYYAAPENPIESMKKNIEEADFFVLCATPRYIQKDIHNETEYKGLSESLHTETGMAIALEKPIIAFVQKGTDVGSVIPKITQYIELTGTEEDLKEKKNLILSLFDNAHKLIKKKSLPRKDTPITIEYNKETTEMWATIGKVAFLAIAIFLIFKIANNKTTK